MMMMPICGGRREEKEAGTEGYSILFPLFLLTVSRK